MKMSVMWTNGLEQLTMYAFDPEAHEITTAPPEDAHHILSDTGTESQDSSLGIWRSRNTRLKEGLRPQGKFGGRPAPGTPGAGLSPWLPPPPEPAHPL